VEGIDVNMVLPSGGVPAFAGLDDVALEAAMYQAYHRFLADYCAPYPDRLTSVILVSARDAAAAVAEIRRCSREAWPVGIFPICPPEMSLDEAAWGPISAEAQWLRHAVESLGEDTLMFATDYPHSESWFPKSAEIVLGWTSLAEGARRRLLWDNALRCYRRFASRAAVTATA